MPAETLGTQPYKGARDFYPKDLAIRNYIFDTWTKVCESYGYEQYDGPLLENFDIYAAKSGEEIVNEQLYSFEDRGGRKVAIRPEMTPTVARMVAQRHKTLTWPVRWFSMPNLWRYEKPQRGRLREHYQLNVDIFGVDDVSADYEIISVAINIMLAFGATKEMFTIKVGSRTLIDDIFTEMGLDQSKRLGTIKAIDKKAKISTDDFVELLEKETKLTPTEIDSLLDFLSKPQPKVDQIAQKSKGAQQAKALMHLLEESGYTEFVQFDPTIMRGFDYYTGSVFEQFDLNPSNNRSMYGGGRYDNLVQEFINQQIPATGLGMGDVTLQLFLEDWNLLPKLKPKLDFLITVWPDDPDRTYLARSLQVAKTLRNLGKNVQTFIEPGTKLDKQLKYADRKGFAKVLIIGESETKNKAITIKDMVTTKQETKFFDEFLNELK